MTDYELHRLCHEYAVLSPFRLEKELIAESGKFKMLDTVLPKLKEEGSRVLLFSNRQKRKMMKCHACRNYVHKKVPWGGRGWEGN